MKLQNENNSLKQNLLNKEKTIENLNSKLQNTNDSINQTSDQVDQLIIERDELVRKNEELTNGLLNFIGLYMKLSPIDFNDFGKVKLALKFVV